MSKQLIALVALLTMISVPFAAQARSTVRTSTHSYKLETTGINAASSVCPVVINRGSPDCSIVLPDAWDAGGLWFQNLGEIHGAINGTSTGNGHMMTEFFDLSNQSYGNNGQGNTERGIQIIFNQGGLIYTAGVTQYNDAFTPPVAPSITGGGGVLGSATIGTAYSHTFTASGAAPFSWSIPSGALPAGLSMSSSGVISGTPSAAGNAIFTVRVGDASGLNDSETFSIQAAAAPSVAGGFQAILDAIELGALYPALAVLLTTIVTMFLIFAGVRIAKRVTGKM